MTDLKHADGRPVTEVHHEIESEKQKIGYTCDGYLNSNGWPFEFLEKTIARARLAETELAKERKRGYCVNAITLRERAIAAEDAHSDLQNQNASLRGHLDDARARLESAKKVTDAAHCQPDVIKLVAPCIAALRALLNVKADSIREYEEVVSSRREQARRVLAELDAATKGKPCPPA